MHANRTKKYVVLHKEVGQTPLQCLEAYRKEHQELQNVPMTYAGRLDPMASGKLLVLIGEECKKQEQYHALDKEYVFQVLFGAASDTGDVLGLLQDCRNDAGITETGLRKAAQKLEGVIKLSYPHFSSKTVQGKPLHQWTLEGRLDEITIPTYQSRIYTLNLIDLRNMPGSAIATYATEKIQTIPPATEERKALGRDFRRDEVRESWKRFAAAHAQDSYTVATFRCVCASGTYMRTLANVLAEALNTCGLAYSIERTRIGRYRHLVGNFGFWTQKW